jgi:hypothetical protein
MDVKEARCEVVDQIERFHENGKSNFGFRTTRGISCPAEGLLACYERLFHDNSEYNKELGAVVFCQ